LDVLDEVYPDDPERSLDAVMRAEEAAAAARGWPRIEGVRR